MIDRDRTFHRLTAATRKRKADDRHAREALAQDNLYPRIAALSRSVPRSENGALDALVSEPPCPDPFSPALGKTLPLANTLKPPDGQIIGRILSGRR
jgi:hypothetical protein